MKIQPSVTHKNDVRHLFRYGAVIYLNPLRQTSPVEQCQALKPI